MLVDISHSVGDYLYNVFFLNLNWVVMVGYVGQTLFGLRFVVQWVATERARRSVFPVAFWFFSIGGGLMTLIYGLVKREPVIIIGQLLSNIIYVRNLMLIFKHHAKASETLER